MHRSPDMTFSDRIATSAGVPIRPWPTHDSGAGTINLENLLEFSWRAGACSGFETTFRETTE